MCTKGFANALQHRALGFATCLFDLPGHVHLLPSWASGCVRGDGREGAPGLVVRGGIVYFFLLSVCFKLRPKPVRGIRVPDLALVCGIPIPDSVMDVSCATGRGPG